MYRVIKVLNNNGILVYHVETGKEMILLGNGVGFGNLQNRSRNFPEPKYIPLSQEESRSLF